MKVKPMDFHPDDLVLRRANVKGRNAREGKLHKRFVTYKKEINIKSTKPKKYFVSLDIQQKIHRISVREYCPLFSILSVSNRFRAYTQDRLKL